MTLTSVVWTAISERTKVEKYLSGFQVPGLEHARSIVNQNPDLREDFTGVMEYLGDEAQVQASTVH